LLDGRSELLRIAKFPILQRKKQSKNFEVSNIQRIFAEDRRRSAI
jgi:hypothetical protein